MLKFIFQKITEKQWKKEKWKLKLENSIGIVCNVMYVKWNAEDSVWVYILNQNKHQPHSLNRILAKLTKDFKGSTDGTDSGVQGKSRQCKRVRNQTNLIIIFLQG